MCCHACCTYVVAGQLHMHCHTEEYFSSKYNDLIIVRYFCSQLYIPLCMTYIHSTLYTHTSCKTCMHCMCITFVLCFYYNYYWFLLIIVATMAKYRYSCFHVHCVCKHMMQLRVCESPQYPCYIAYHRLGDYITKDTKCILFERCHASHASNSCMLVITLIFPFYS